MTSLQNKGKLVLATIISIIVITAGFIIIVAILKSITSDAEEKTAEVICRGSVAR